MLAGLHGPGRGATEVSLPVHTELPRGTRVAGGEGRGHEAAPAAPAELCWSGPEPRLRRRPALPVHPDGRTDQNSPGAASAFGISKALPELRGFPAAAAGAQSSSLVLGEPAQRHPSGGLS